MHGTHARAYTRVCVSPCMEFPYILRLLWAARTFAGYYGPPLHLLANMGRPYICRFEASLSKFAIETPRVAP